MGRRPSPWLAGLILAALLLSIGGYVLLRMWYPPVEGWMSRVPPDPHFKTLDTQLRDRFLDRRRPVSERYRDLFVYFVAGLVRYKTPDGTRVHYPGAGSVHGQHVDGVEGYSRMAPLVAAWLSGSRSSRVDVPELGEVDLLDWLREGLTTGTDPSAPGYWGDITAGTQVFFEAADIALALWLSRDQLWFNLDSRTQEQIARWLMATQHGNRPRFLNWNLVPLIVNRVMRALGVEVPDTAFQTDWAAVRAGYLGGGWFRDGEELDYYNAWAFHYSLYWLAHLDPQLDAEFARAARREFAVFYRHLITPRGVPILGRSICYRTATPVPLIVEALSDAPVVELGQALRALDAVWEYFVSHGAVANGTLTQGYCGPDLRILDRYSGPASCLWGVRSLVLAFSQPDESPFWLAEQQPLPVEIRNFSIRDDTSGWRLEGRHADGVVTIHRDGQSQTPALAPMRWHQRLAEHLLQRPFRPRNRDAKYAGSMYSSDPPFCGCVQ